MTPLLLVGAMLIVGQRVRWHRDPKRRVWTVLPDGALVPILPDDEYEVVE